MTATAAPGKRVSRLQRIAFTTVSILAGIYAGLIGLMGLLTFGFYAGNIHRVQQLGLGVLWGLLVAGALLLQARSPHRRTALFQQLVAAAVALLAAVTLGDVVDVAPLAMVVALVILGVLHPAREALFRIGSRPSVVAAAFAVAAAVPLVFYGLGQAAIERASAPGSFSTGQWTHMTATAIAIPFTGLVASLRAPGWRISAWTAGLGAALLGLAWVLFPGLASAPGVAWGLAAIAGGGAFIGLCEWEAGRPLPVEAAA